MKGGQHRRRGRAKRDIRTVLVIFGSSGNLATTRLIPAVGALEDRGELPGGFLMVGVDRKRPGKGTPPHGFSFIRGDLSLRGTYAALAQSLNRIAGAEGVNVLYYLATKPQLFPRIADGLQREGPGPQGPGWRRVAVEKPFGVDLGSSEKLERSLRSAFGRDSVFRVDHFLAKDGALGIARFRFEGGGIEPLWNSRFVDQVQIMADEGTGVEGRGEFYDSVGVVRDMVQNHLMQLLCLVAMEPPGSQDPEALGKARAEVLRSMRPPVPSEAAWGQYIGYRREAGVRRGTRTPTFVAMRLSVENRRWKGVPFYVRTGRVLARNATEVVVVFRRRPGAEDRLVRFCIDPAAQTVVGFGEGGRPGRASKVRAAAGGAEYERVILGALKGEQRWFADAGFNRLAWKLVDPLLKSEERGGQGPAPYEPGSWGPEGAAKLLAAGGSSWMPGPQPALP